MFSFNNITHEQARELTGNEERRAYLAYTIRTQYDAETLLEMARELNGYNGQFEEFDIVQLDDLRHDLQTVNDVLDAVMSGDITDLNGDLRYNSCNGWENAPEYDSLLDEARYYDVDIAGAFCEVYAGPIYDAVFDRDLLYPDEQRLLQVWEDNDNESAEGAA